MTCPDENQLALLGEAALDPAMRVELEAHIDRCEACDLLVRELAGLEVAAQRGDEHGPSVPSRYRVERRLGRGGMGVVWAADDRELDRKVALKVVRGERGDKLLRTRLLREARMLAGVKHPNVVTVYDVGEHADQVFLAMELVEGETARSWREGAARSPAEILDVWISVAAGLGALHAAGIVHRDMKPDNVLVAHDGRVMVCDLGVATGGQSTALTQNDHTVGTLAYMAPEQLYGEPVDARADQFAWCAAVWEAIAGNHPFRGDTTVSRAVSIAGGPPRADGEHAGILAILARGLARDRARRWADMAALTTAIAAARTGAGPERRGPARRGPVIASLLGFVALAAAGVAIVASMRHAAAPSTGAEPAAIDPGPLAAMLDGAVAVTDGAVAVTDGAVTDGAVASASPLDAASRGARTRPDAAPAAELPAGTTDAYARYNAAAAIVSRAEAAAARRDGACDRELATLPAANADLGTQLATRVEDVRARCAIVRDCTRGKQQLAALLRSRGRAEDGIARDVGAADTELCAVDAPGTPPERDQRVGYRLMLANAASAPCADLVDAAEAAHIKPPLFELRAAPCLARAGLCDRARAYATSDAQRAQLVAEFPACAMP